MCERTVYWTSWRSPRRRRGNDEAGAVAQGVVELLLGHDDGGLVDGPAFRIVSVTMARSSTWHAPGPGRAVEGEAQAVAAHEDAALRIGRATSSTPMRVRSG